MSPSFEVTNVACSLQSNYAMSRLKESLLSQMALNSLFAACVVYLEDEFKGIDRIEKKKSPPRFLSPRYKVKRRWNK